MDFSRYHRLPVLPLGDRRWLSCSTDITKTHITMKYNQTKSIPITAITVEHALPPGAPAFYSLVLSPHEVVDQSILSGPAHIVLVTEGEVTLRFADYDRYLESEVAMHIPVGVPYSIWNHTPWRSKILRAELNPGSFASPTKSKGSSYPRTASIATVSAVRLPERSECLLEQIT